MKKAAPTNQPVERVLGFRLQPVAAGCAVLLLGTAQLAQARQATREVTAEDIGKLPDTSIAELIARLPGLSAQRVAGRAQVISVRGLSPDVATTLLNAGLPAGTTVTDGIKSLARSGINKHDGFMGVLECKPNKDWASTLDVYSAEFTKDAWPQASTRWCAAGTTTARTRSMLTAGATRSSSPACRCWPTSTPPRPRATG